MSNWDVIRAVNPRTSERSGTYCVGDGLHSLLTQDVCEKRTEADADAQHVDPSSELDSGRRDAQDPNEQKEEREIIFFFFFWSWQADTF